jgi:dihydroorotate dehydrogenase
MIRDQEVLEMSLQVRILLTLAALVLLPVYSAVASGEVVSAVRAATSKPIIAKLTPQVTDVVEVARRVREAGASAVTLTNRFMGFAVDAENARPYINGWAGVGGVFCGL